VILEVQPELLALLTPAAHDWGVTLLARGAARPHFDCHCPLLSLPLAFNTSLETIPAQAQYLSAPSASITRWQSASPRAANPARRRVGLAWSGRLKSRRETRAVPLSLLEPLLQQIDCDWVILQKDTPASDQAAWQRIQALPNVQTPVFPLNDFADTAGLIATLDQVVSIDTSVAHLAAALGKPTWILLAYAADWRWLLERADSPWYPSVRLLRQASQDDWSAPLEALSQALRSAAI
jgi:hypothetical protein